MTTADTSRQILGDRYELRDLIAVGGMGEVWRARDVLLDRPVAVKVLRSEYADNPVFVARFRTEARNAASLSHPNIAAVLDYGESTAERTGEHLAYLVMELVDGPPLSARLAEDGSLGTSAALAVLQQAAAGLAAAHTAGVVHRDVKPANILLTPDGTVKLTDFGISWSAGSVPLTQTGQVIGTAQYMSPEQAMGEHVGPASDVYALGLVGYESLAGHAAFDGDNPVTVALKQVQEHPEPLPADLPQDVRALIDAALVKNPDDRLPDGNAFLHAVEETMHGPPDTASLTRPVAVVATGHGVAPRRGTGAHRGAGHPGVAIPKGPGARRVAGPAEQPAARRRALLVALPLLAVLLLGGGVAALIGAAGSDPGGSAGAVESQPTDVVDLVAADYVGRPVEEVVAELSALGLTVRLAEDPAPGGVAGTVTGVQGAGARLSPGDEVVVLVAAPPEAPSTPTPADGGDAPAPAPAPVPRPEPAATRPVPPAPEQPEPGTPAPSSPADEAGGAGTATPSTPVDGATGTPTPTEEPAEPTPPTEPTEDPTEPTEDPAEPTEDPAEPTTPTEDGEEPAEPTTPTEPTATEPTTPTEPTPTDEPTTPPTATTEAPTTPEPEDGTGDGDEDGTGESDEDGEDDGGTDPRV
ncbi:protein kinase domain-containing protein [Blastococcus sp. VKM Ac-2987]|uniref:protein kinase domain-containing protein n=1 Tax=Blastococcus sp. VKM Ac-2987 TaxID=3004141 RepID=UPI0022AB53F3|nr:protein kinase [Blastococcus sp. VKM Ac-2987]MCZ2860516.1 protein kinase [Blastococcus sp. VKM Ac-2987]